MSRRCIQVIEVPKGECYLKSAKDNFLGFHNDLREDNRVTENPVNNNNGLRETVEVGPGAREVKVGKGAN